jgi:hypothetical protein
LKKKKRDMEIEFRVSRIGFIPHVETFFVRSQEKECPPELINILVHKIHAELRQDRNIREFHFPFKHCPANVRIEIIE